MDLIKVCDLYFVLFFKLDFFRIEGFYKYFLFGIKFSFMFLSFKE